MLQSAFVTFSSPIGDVGQTLPCHMFGLAMRLCLRLIIHLGSVLARRGVGCVSDPSGAWCHAYVPAFCLSDGCPHCFAANGKGNLTKA